MDCLNVPSTAFRKSVSSMPMAARVLRMLGIVASPTPMRGMSGDSTRLMSANFLPPVFSVAFR